MTYEIIDNDSKPTITYTGGQFDGLTEAYYGKPKDGYTDKNAPNWLGVEQALFYSGLRAKAKASANLDQFEFASLIGAFANGKQGLTSEGTLYYLLGAINADWDAQDIALLNTLLTQNNFTIQL